MNVVAHIAMPDAAPDSPAVPETAGPRTNADLREEAIGRMIRTAISLIAKGGASKLSLVDVGRMSGYSHSLPTYYFKTKTRLLMAVYEFIIAQARPRSTEWMAEHVPNRVRPGLSNIEATIRAYLGLGKADQERWRAMHVIWAESFSSMPSLLEAVRPTNASTVNHFEEQIRIAVQRGEMSPDVNTANLAMVIVATLRGTVSQYLMDPDRMDLEQMAQTIIQLVRHGATPRPAETRSPPEDS